MRNPWQPTQHNPRSLKIVSFSSQTCAAACSIGDLAIRSFRNEMRQPPPTLVGARVSLRTRRRHRPDEGCPHRLTRTPTDGHNSSGGGDNGCTHASSTLEPDGGEFEAVVAVDRYNGSDGYPALYVQVCLKLNAIEPTRSSGRCPICSVPNAPLSDQNRSMLLEGSICVRREHIA